MVTHERLPHRMYCFGRAKPAQSAQGRTPRLVEARVIDYFHCLVSLSRAVLDAPKMKLHLKGESCTEEQANASTSVMKPTIHECPHTDRRSSKKVESSVRVCVYACVYVHPRMRMALTAAPDWAQSRLSQGTGTRLVILSQPISPTFTSDNRRTINFDP